MSTNLMHLTLLKPATMVYVIRNLCVGGVAGEDEEGTVCLQYMPLCFVSLELQIF